MKKTKTTNILKIKMLGTCLVKKLIIYKCIYVKINV